MGQSFAQAIFVATNGISFFAFIALAIIALRNGPKTRYLYLWSLSCLLWALVALSITLITKVDSYPVADSFVRTTFTFGAISQLGFLLFAFSFFGDVRLGIVFKSVGLCWCLSLIPLFWTTDFVAAGVTKSEFSPWAPVAGPWMPAYLLFLLYGWWVPIGLFISRFRKSVGLMRIQAAYMLAAFLIGFLAMSGTLLPASLRSQTLLAMLPGLLMPLFPFIITYAMIRHRLWDIRTIVHRTVVWALLSIGLVVPLYLLLRISASLALDMDVSDQALLLTLLYILANSYLSKVKPHLDHWFQRRRYDRLAALDHFVIGRAQLEKPNDVAKNALETISAALYPENATLIYRRGEGVDWIKIEWPQKSEKESLAEAELSFPASFVAYLVNNNSALDISQFELDEKSAAFRAQTLSALSRFDAQVCQPLVQREDLFGLIMLSEKKNLKPYSREDLEFIDQIGVATAVGLSNALLYDKVDAQRLDLEDLTQHLEERVATRTSELEEANKKVSEAYKRLQELDRMKSRFFANINHELRTPLSLVLAPIESMLDGDLGNYDEGQRQQLAGIQRNAMQLLKLIDDMLDLSKLEETRLRLRLDVFDFTSLCGRIVDLSQPLAERKEVEMVFHRGDGFEIEADQEKLERVIINLLSNALKFTDVGGRVELLVEKVDDYAVCTVKDTGVGIPEDQLEYIFDRFHQVESEHSQRVGGTGIGLSLARELAELHNGDLNVSSVLGQGSSFVLRIPVDSSSLPEDRIEVRNQKVKKEGRGIPEWSDQIRASEQYRFIGIDQATERRVAPRVRSGTAKIARLMVVDDNPDMLRFLDQILGEKYDMWHLQEGKTALEMLVRHRHDLVISDVMMPGMSGFELCKRIKSDPRIQETPVILLTARGGDQGRIEGHWVGADQYLTKPFKPAELEAAIDGLLAGRARQIEAAAHRRSASLETLLAGLAHELRNAAHQAKSSQSAAWRLFDKLQHPSEQDQPDLLLEQLHEMEQISRRALDRIGVVVLSLQQYAFKRMQVPWQEHQIDELVRREVGRLGPADEKKVDVQLELASDATIRGPQDEIRQMVINLVENAIQAVDDGGWVKVSTQNAVGKVLLRVTDNGCGIPAANRDQIFDLFFTSKDPGKGIGLGLALAKRTVTDLGGKIKVNSEEGQGTEFVIEIPRVEEIHADAEEASGDQSSVPSHL